MTSTSTERAPARSFIVPRSLSVPRPAGWSLLAPVRSYPLDHSGTRKAPITVFDWGPDVASRIGGLVLVASVRAQVEFYRGPIPPPLLKLRPRVPSMVLVDRTSELYAGPGQRWSGELLVWPLTLAHYEVASRGPLRPLTPRGGARQEHL